MMPKMRLWKAFLLIALLVCCFASAALADANLILEGDDIGSLCWQGDTLYLLGRETVYRWQPGQEAPETLWQTEGTGNLRYWEEPPADEANLTLWKQAVCYIVPGKEGPLALHPYSGELMSVAANGLTVVGTIPQDKLTFTMEDMTMYRGIIDVAGQDGVVWLLLDTDDPMSWDGWSKKTVLRYDTADSSVMTFDVSGVNHIAAAEGNLLLSVDDSGVHVHQLVDGRTGELIRQYEAASETAIWAQGGVLEYVGGELLLTDDAGSRAAKGYVSLGNVLVGGDMDCSDSGLCAIANGGYVFIRDLNNPAEKTVLRVSGYLWSDQLLRFSISNPDIALVTLGESAQQSAMTGSADLYVVEAPGAYGTLVSHKGLAPINDDALVAQAGAFYEGIRDVLMPEGQLLAWPTQIITNTWSLDETLWARFDMGDVPTTWSELMDAFQRWQDDYATDEPDYKLGELPYSVEDCLRLLVREYILQSGDGYPDFTSEDFRQAVLAVLAHQAAIDKNAESWGEPLIYSYSIGFGLQEIGESVTRMMLKPAITTDGPQRLSADLTLLAISNASQQQEAATRFIRWYAENMSVELRYELDPTLNEPVRHDNHESRLADLLAQKEAIEAAIAAGETPELKEQLAQQERMIARQEDKWKLSAQSIANYREVAENIFVPYRSPLLTNEGGMAALDERIGLYCGQGLNDATLDRLLQELNSVAQMIMMENQ